MVSPVLTSNNSSLGQIGGEAAILVDPHSIDSIAKGLEVALQPEKLKELSDWDSNGYSYFNGKRLQLIQ